MLKYLLLGWFGATVLYAQQSPTWVAYSAKYSDTTKDTDRSGHTAVQQVVGEEIRSSDGSLLITITENGERTKGRLWPACGHMITLDYAQHKAVFGESAPRKHPYQPPDVPQGTMTVDGVEFVAFPIHSNVGTGTIWIDMNDDIMGKMEMHLNLPDGVHRETVHQVASLDLNSPVDDSATKIPPQFTIEGKSSGGCVSSGS